MNRAGNYRIWQTITVVLTMVTTMTFITHYSMENGRYYSHQQGQDILAIKERQLEKLRGDMERLASDYKMAENTMLSKLSSELIKEQFGFKYYLPHLLHHPGALVPRFLITKQRANVSLVIGLPTIKRPKGFFLDKTVHSLLNNLGNKTNCCVIIVFLADLKDEDAQTTINFLKREFPNAIESGLLEILSPRKEFYPDFRKLPRTLKDAPDRVAFRSKQVLDYAYLMSYARNRGKYYIQVEDDVITVPGYYDRIMKSIDFYNKKGHWTLLQFSDLGFIGKLFRTETLYRFVDFLAMFYYNQPVDWLMAIFLANEACPLGGGDKRCRIEKNKIGPVIQPALFQHMGSFSSFRGVRNNLKDRNFPGVKKNENDTKRARTATKKIITIKKTTKH